ncbi:hypothetical protein [Streptomyces europaeiscabiei]|uniref:hypothetical protein n=1 Tax=Streptomyces europaeiscabiei TaxID=146819 RepID=UPI002E2673E6|nr:hypothetical protein OG858_47535 [Streptomyces europaeiscabiei]
MTSTLTEKAVTGRHVTFTHYRNLSDGPTRPGIITGTEPGYNGALLARVRLDGERSNLCVPVDYEGLTYLDQITDVPELPMGRFHPTADDFGGDWEGVPVCSLDNEAIVILTADRLRAAGALAAFCKDMGFDREYLPSMEDRWAVFEWQPEDAEIPWFMDLAEQGDDQAIHIHYLPA